MSGFEKLCEFSGEHCGWNMHHIKHNHIQILPKFRKNFRHAEARLVIRDVKAYWDNDGILMQLQPFHLQGWIPGKSDSATPHEVLAHEKKKGGRLVLQYNYALIVDEKSLSGIVRGTYRNFSYDIGTVRRRLSRMLGYKVPVEWHCPRQSFKQRQTFWATHVLDRIGYTEAQMNIIKNMNKTSGTPQ